MKGLVYIPIIFSLSLIAWQVFSPTHPEKFQTLMSYYSMPLPTDTNPDDTLPYPLPDDQWYGPGSGYNHPLYLSDPSNIKDSVVYDPESNSYYFYRKMGDIDYRPPYEMSFDEYQSYDFDKAMNDYWHERISATAGAGGNTGLIPTINVGGKAFEGIFGSNTIDIRPSGTAELIFGVNANRRDDPALNVKQRRTANFDFQEKIQMNVQAKIGDKIDFGVKYNTESSFEFENKMKLKYEGKEDEIIKSIEAGDVTLPLNSTLIQGSQSLFGIKSQLQFGKATVTSVVSQQKGQTSNITVTGGAQTSEFEIYADEYEEKKHFFMGQYFRNNYNKWLKDLPIVGSPVNITKVEVWVTNIGPATQENRNIVALLDVGEYDPYNNTILPNLQADAIYPSNRSNNMFDIIDVNQVRDINNVNSYLAGVGFDNSIDYEKVENARLLSPTEYTFNSKLGFISLNSTLNDDQVLAIAYQYTVLGSDSIYQVGEFSNGGIASPECLTVKLLKSTAQNTQIPLWDLMMKNVYAIGGYQVNPDDFRLDVLYKSDELGVPAGYLLEGDLKGIPLIRVLNMDNLNGNGDPESDGVFDFIDQAAIYGGTINARNGRVYFPVLEPFGKDLRAFINDQALADKYCYDSLYTMTKTGARQFPDKNRFTIAGQFKSSVGNEISLNAMNIPQGSVRVTAGGVPLTENVDYTVDYTLGRVKIINEGVLNSGAPINISLESNSLFSIQTKTFLGTHVDYEVSNNFMVGATILSLTERPFTYKVNIGEEPISNTMWGVNLSYQTESRLLTKAVDALPFIQTKAPSKVTVDAEFANLVPGHARAIGKEGTAYIDDFEGSKSSIDIKNVGTWFLSSVPQGQNAIFPEAADDSTLVSGFNRSKLAWYVIDPLFFRDNNLTPEHIKNDDEMQSDPYMREVLESEVFPNKQNPNGIITNIAVLDLAYYPEEKGPYNYDVSSSPYSAGIDASGALNDPGSRWGGIMRKIETPDFEETNVEYIEFWMMDPFINNPSHSGGKLYFNLGDISEDVLRDHRKSYENGLPTSSAVVDVDTTQWGRVPLLQALVNSFDNDPTSRQYQDVGLDGLGDADEQSFFQSSYINDIATTFGTASQAYANAVADPSADNFHYFRGSDYDADEVDILNRYKKYNGMDGNSPTSDQSPETYPTSATTLPNVEDINRDNTLSEAERYFQYIIDLQPSKMNVGENYISDVYTAPGVQLENNTTTDVKWYQFKIPVKDPDQIIGNIQDFKSIRFMRIFLREFSEPIVLRFATLELVRSQWRKYENALLGPGEYIPGDDQNGTSFEISAVNIEENGARTPIPYVLPPGIDREVGYGSTTLYEMNEQALVLKTCNLIDGDARAVYKTTDFDIRQYKRLKMYIHSEATNPDMYTLNPGDLTLFVRLGTDFTSNYYEYEVPLNPTSLNISSQDPNIQNLVWADSLDIELEKFVALKIARNIAMRSDGSTISLSTPFYQYDGANKVTIVGIPNLSDVRTLMIGIRNPKRSPVNLSDDGMAKCAEIWINELRLSEFDEDGGWAATTRVTADLADLGNVVMVGNVSTAGFGSIEKKVSERQKENITSYDLATNIELGKFLPEKSGIRVPMHFDYSETFSNPQYNPMSPDLYLSDDLDTYASQREKDSIINIVQDYTRRKSINFINVRKEKTGTDKKARIYDISNFDFTYAYNEVFQRNIDVEYNLKKNFRGALGYNFNNTPKNYQPFKKVKLLRTKAFRLIGDFNFYLMPKSLSFRTDMNRSYEENLWRNKSGALLIIEPTYLKTFNWNRTYSLKYDLTKSIKIDYNASAIARIDEAPGRVDKSESDYEFKMDSIWTNIKNMGRITSFNQSIKLNYALPINKLPFMDWVSTSVQYQGDYTWTAAPLYKDSLGEYKEHPYANTIENNRTISVNANGNMTNLYNYFPYLKKLNGNTRPPRQNRSPGVSDEDPDSTAVDDDKIPVGKTILDNFLKFLMMTKNVSFSYTLAEGTVLPGFRAKPVAMGMDLDNQAPGWGFVFGDQRDIRQSMVDKGLITNDTLLNNAFMTRKNENINARVSLEPANGFRIEITAMRNYSINHNEYFRYDGSSGFKSYSPIDNGSFSMSIITWKTAFITDNNDYSNNTFIEFMNSRPGVASLVASQSPNWDGTYFTDSITGQSYPTGYGPTSQDVLIPAFLAAYTGGNINKYAKSKFPKIPLPNWRISYNGLTKIPWFKKRFKSFTVSHAYRSTYNIGGFTSNVLFNDLDNDGYTFVQDAMDNFLPQYEIAQVSVTEQYSPLINLDATWQNSLISKFEFKKSRNLAMSFANNQLTEVVSSEITIGLGYRFKDVELQISNKSFKSDLNLKLDFSIRNNKTILRKIVEDVNQISAGQKVMSINASAEYQLSQKFTIRAFFDKVINNPYISSQFLTSNTNAGISMRFSLAQ